MTIPRARKKGHSRSLFLDRSRSCDCTGKRRRIATVMWRGGCGTATGSVDAFVVNIHRAFLIFVFVVIACQRASSSAHSGGRCDA